MRQAEPIPATVRYSADHLYEESSAGRGEHRRYVNLWQVGLARELGRQGLVLAGVGTLALLAVAVISFVGLRARLRAVTTP